MQIKESGNNGKQTAANYSAACRTGLSAVATSLARSRVRSPAAFSALACRIWP